MWVADRVDEALERYRETHGITSTWETRERVVVAITGAPGGEAVIRRPARMAARTKGELVGVYVRLERRPRRLGPPRVSSSQRQLLDELGGEVPRDRQRRRRRRARPVRPRARTPPRSCSARRNARGWIELVRGSVINRVIRDVRDRSTSTSSRTTTKPGRDRLREAHPSGTRPALSPRRHVVGVGARRRAAPILLTVVLATMRDSVNLPTISCCTCSSPWSWPRSAASGRRSFAAVGGFLLANWYFTPPLHTLTIDDGDNVARARRLRRDRRGRELARAAWPPGDRGKRRAPGPTPRRSPASAAAWPRERRPAPRARRPAPRPVRGRRRRRPPPEPRRHVESRGRRRRAHAGATRGRRRSRSRCGRARSSW